MRRVRKTLEFQGITGRVEQEHSGLLTDFTRKAGARRDQKSAIELLEPGGKRLPIMHIEDDAKMSRRNVVTIDRIGDRCATVIAR